MTEEPKFVVTGEPVSRFSLEAQQKFIEERLSKKPPKGVWFRVGDIVTFVNDNGVSFPGMKVIGFSNPSDLNGRCVHLAGYSPYWFPKYPHQLTLEEPARDGWRYPFRSRKKFLTSFCRRLHLSFSYRRAIKPAK